MKVVLFCGGLGMRLREYSDRIPKPLAEIGSRPLLWHLMKYYAHYGFKDFILCLGYGAGAIKDYFVDYREYVSNDFVLSEWRQAARPAATRHRRLAHHVRGHWPALQHRSAPDEGSRAPRAAKACSWPTMATAFRISIAASTSSRS